MIKKRYTISLCIIIFISILLHIGLTKASEMGRYFGEPTTVLMGVKANIYDWDRDHCGSCGYLAEQIKHWMSETEQLYNWRARNLTANMTANYLKLYELNGCHEYYRNTSIGPFHIALELKALEEKASGKTGKTGKVLE